MLEELLLRSCLLQELRLRLLELCLIDPLLLGDLRLLELSLLVPVLLNSLWLLVPVLLRGSCLLVKLLRSRSLLVELLSLLRSWSLRELLVVGKCVESRRSGTLVELEVLLSIVVVSSILRIVSNEVWLSWACSNLSLRSIVLVSSSNYSWI